MSLYYYSANMMKGTGCCKRGLLEETMPIKEEGFIVGKEDGLIKAELFVLKAFSFLTINIDV